MPVIRINMETVLPWLQ